MPGSAFPRGTRQGPVADVAASGPWGHSLETEERTNGLHLEPSGDPRIYDEWSELQDE